MDRFKGFNFEELSTLWQGLKDMEEDDKEKEILIEEIEKAIDNLDEIVIEDPRANK